MGESAPSGLNPIKRADKITQFHSTALSKVIKSFGQKSRLCFCRATASVETNTLDRMCFLARVLIREVQLESESDRVKRYRERN